MTAADRQRGAVRACAFVLLVLFCFAASAAAQSKRPPPRAPRPIRPTPHAGSIELSGGVLWQGGFDLGTVNAELERNPTTGTGPLDLFAAGSKLGSGIGFQGRVAAYLSTRLAIEGGVRVTRPKLDIKLSADFESAPDQTATETMTQYVIDGSAVLQSRALPSWPGRAVHCRGRRLHSRSPRGQRADRNRDRVSRPRGNQVVVLGSPESPWHSRGRRLLDPRRRRSTSATSVERCRSQQPVSSISFDSGTHLHRV